METQVAEVLECIECPVPQWDAVQMWILLQILTKQVLSVVKATQHLMPGS